jgi:hypothetical protein
MDGAIEGPDYLEQIDTRAQYDSLAADGVVKYLTIVDGREPLVPKTPTACSRTRGASRSTPSSCGPCSRRSATSASTPT